MRTLVIENLRPGYDSLAEAIVIQAGKDYLELKKILWTKGYDKQKERELEDVKKFFRSNWYRVLTDVSSEYLLNQLDAKFEEWKAQQLAEKIIN